MGAICVSPRLGAGSRHFGIHFDVEVGEIVGDGLVVTGLSPSACSEGCRIAPSRPRHSAPATTAARRRPIEDMTPRYLVKSMFITEGQFDW